MYLNLYLFDHQLFKNHFVIEILDTLWLKEVVDFSRLLVEDSSAVECVIKLLLVYSSRYWCIIEYHHTVVQEDWKKITFWKTMRKNFYSFLKFYLFSISLRFLSLYFFPHLFLIENLFVILIIMNYNSFFNICIHFVF